MRLPSYLIRNRFGVYYFRIVFPVELHAILNKKDSRRSLRTCERSIATCMSMEFQQVNKKLFKIIIRDQMKWIEAKKLFDDVAEKLFQKYVERVEVVGFDFEDADTLSSIMPEATTFISPSTPEWTHDLYWDQDAKKMVNRVDFEANFHQQPEVVRFVDGIIKQHKLPIQTGDEEYKKFCLQALEMLYRLDQKKAQYKKQQRYGDQGGISNIVTTNDDSDLPKINIRELIDKFIDNKINIEKSWSNTRTVKGYKENLGRVGDIIEYVTKKNTSISTMTKDNAREVRKILLIIPKNMKKKFPNFTFKQIIKKCQKGEIAQLESERMSPNTFNTYANLISGLFKFAHAEDYIKENYFTNLRVKKQVKKTRSAFTDDELSKFFNTDLFTQKDFPSKWSWRFWVPVIMLYTGARVEEICQLYLDDIYEEQGVLCFHLRVKIDLETEEKITSLKNNQSERLIPVHPKLKKIGLLKYIQYLKDNGEDRLFPTLKNKDKTGKYKQVNPPVSKWFNENNRKQRKTSYINKCGITDDSKVLYCFRHTVQTLLFNHKDDIEHEKIYTLMGHERKSTALKHYVTYDTATLLKIVRKIDYPNALLPWDNDKNYSKVKFPWQS